MSKRHGEEGIYRSAAGAHAVKQRYRQLLDQWPIPSEFVRVPTREGETFVVACGPKDAPPVLALQGSGGNAAMWLPEIAELAQHLRVYAVDVIGEPGLSAPSRPSFASEAYALWLDDVLRGLALTRVALLGVSMGGWLALDYATRRPQRVTCLALLSPAGVGRRKSGLLAVMALLLLFGDWGRRKALALALGSGSRTPTANHAPPRRTTHPRQTRLRDAALLDFVLLTFKNFKPRMQAQPTFQDAVLRRLTMPLLAIAGGRDAMLDSHQTKQRLEAAVPHATVRLLPGVGHRLPDQSDVVLDFLRDSNVVVSDA